CLKNGMINYNVCRPEKGGGSIRAKVIKATGMVLELRTPLSRDKRRATDDSSKKATAAPDPVARRPFRMIARFYVFIPGSCRAAFHRADVSVSIANRNSFRSLSYLCCTGKERR
ncbi:hypothetical protein X777_05892, partial [Ooceraea biroi]